VNLKTLGWNPELQRALAELEERRWIPGRVVAEHRGAWRVHTGERELLARATGRLRHKSSSPLDLPGVGDWVALNTGKNRRPTVEAVLPRRSVFVRKVAGLHAKVQVVAANIDHAFLMMSLDGDFNVRRLERYLAATWESGAVPVILLNKLDQSDSAEREEALKLVEEVAAGTPILGISAKTGEGLEGLAPFLDAQQTICLLGSSGVGKSTLLNKLKGAQVQVTAEVRDKDGKGRHTTTHRELFALEGGALVVDTPGMREMRLWSSAGLADAFPEIADLADTCKYRDCHHTGDEGCAVDAAVSAGRVEAERWEAWLKLTKELQEIEALRSKYKRR
jgi:ribosome biogenesis GTPase